MKREVSSVTTDADLVADDWCSGATAILDSFDEDMWDELRDIVSPPHTPRPCVETQSASPALPMDVIRRPSPVGTPSVHTNNTHQHCDGGLICGDSPMRSDHQQLSMPIAGGSFSVGAGVAQLDGVWATEMVNTPVTSSEVLEMKRDPSTATPVTCASDQLIDCDQSPNINATERRRQKNRDCMRKARQKQREELQDMKATVTRLEKQYAELSLWSLTAVANASATLHTMASSNGLVTRSRMASEYTAAIELARRLGAENLYLKADIQRQTAWKLNLSRILQSRVEVDGPRWAQQFQQPALGGEEVLRMQLDKMDKVDAREELGFHALSDIDLTHVILENQRTISRVKSRLLVWSSLDSEDGARTRRMQTFGWDMVQRVHGKIMEYSFTKKFRGLDVAQLMRKTWANDMRLGEFRKVKGETCRLTVLQQVNPNAYVLCRDVASPTNDITIFRSVFVRFLIETNKKIPASAKPWSSTGIDVCAPLTPPPSMDLDLEDELMLEATGYILGTQSVDTDYSKNPRPEDVYNKVAWAHLCLSIEFLNVVNPVTGEEYQQMCWSGRTDYCGEEHAQRNASDMLHGMLRWELLLISPALNLVSLSME